MDGHVEIHLVHEPRRCAGPGDQARPRRQVRLQRSRGLGVIEADDLRPELGDLFTNHLPGSPRGQAHRGEPLAVVPDELEGLLTDGAGAPEDEDSLGQGDGGGGADPGERGGREPFGAPSERRAQDSGNRRRGSVARKCSYPALRVANTTRL